MFSLFWLPLNAGIQEGSPLLPHACWCIYRLIFCLLLRRLWLFTTCNHYVGHIFQWYNFPLNPCMLKFTTSTDITILLDRTLQNEDLDDILVLSLHSKYCKKRTKLSKFQHHYNFIVIVTHWMLHRPIINSVLLTRYLTCLFIETST